MGGEYYKILKKWWMLKGMKNAGLKKFLTQQMIKTRGEQLLHGLSLKKRRKRKKNVPKYTTRVLLAKIHLLKTSPGMPIMQGGVLLSKTVIAVPSIISQIWNTK